VLVLLFAATMAQPLKCADMRAMRLVPRGRLSTDMRGCGIASSLAHVPASTSGDGEVVELLASPAAAMHRGALRWTKNGNASAPAGGCKRSSAGRARCDDRLCLGLLAARGGA
jgi:hypothetical protein